MRTVSLITERRASKPWGLFGGEPGAPGENWLLPAGDGSRAERLADKCTVRLPAGDVVRMLTPAEVGGVPPATAGPRADHLRASLRPGLIVSGVLALDHVIVVVAGLDSAARRLYREHGLASVAGGRHAGHGTGNRIVPLGSSYIELMAVVDRDEAALSPVGSWVGQRLVEVGEAPVALCLRTDDIEVTAQRTGCKPLAMSRTRPDGVELAWQLVALDAALTDGLPFFIHWHVDDADHPSREHVEHRCAPIGIGWVEIGGDEDRLASWLGDHELPLRHVQGPPGPHRLAVATSVGEPVLIG